MNNYYIFIKNRNKKTSLIINGIIIKKIIIILFVIQNQHVLFMKNIKGIYLNSCSTQKTFFITIITYSFITIIAHSMTTRI